MRSHYLLLSILLFSLRRKDTSILCEARDKSFAYFCYPFEEKIPVSYAQPVSLAEHTSVFPSKPSFPLKSSIKADSMRRRDTSFAYFSRSKSSCYLFFCMLLKSSILKAYKRKDNNSYPFEASFVVSFLQKENS